MKVTAIRSTVGLGLNLSTRQHGQSKGRGSYDRSKAMAAMKAELRKEFPNTRLTYRYFEKIA